MLATLIRAVQAGARELATVPVEPVPRLLAKAKDKAPSAPGLPASARSER